MNNQIKVGDVVYAKIDGWDTHYTDVIGRVTGVKTTGWVNIKATVVKDRWGDEFERHPTSCGMGVKITDCIIID